MIAGTEEAELSGLGVLSAFPRANGIVADLGGGSLELVGVARSMVGEGVSLPLGVQRIEGHSVASLRKAISSGVPSRLMATAARDHSLYLVGGSLRALAQLDLALLDHPLPILHHHRIDPARFDELEKAISTIPADELMRTMGISPSRVAALAPGLTILRAMAAQLEPRRILTSAFGLREGILYRDLSAQVRREDPLLAASLEAAQRLGRFGDHGALLDQWLGGLFEDDSPDAQRYRLAACLLGDIAWNAHPDFRSERAVDLAIHGNWVGIDAHGRVLLGRTLHSAFSGKGTFDRRLAALLRPGEEERAEAWGRAIRLAQRLSGGTAALLRRTSLARRGRKLVLKLPSKSADLYAAPVERRLAALAKAMDREAMVEFV
jgi:exopolyphosphatase/guanosine-5'-triphosphate,3'-diphosphate pyrophosphatase